MSEINGQGSGGQVLAERSGWPVAGTVTLWTLLAMVAVFLGVTQSLMPGSIGKWRMMSMIFVIVVWGVAAVCYTYFAIVTPKILAEYRDGVILLHPTVYRSVTLRPEDIIFVAQRNYHGHITYSSGKLTISTTKGNIAVRWVKDVDDARRKIELLRNTAMLTPQPLQPDGESGFL